MYWKQNDLTDIKPRSFHGGDGEIKTRGFFDEASRLPIKFQVWELDPGVSEGKHVHEDDEALEEIYYFISGEAVMSVDQEEVSLKAGDAILVPPGVDHGFYNSGTEPLKMIIVWGVPSHEGKAWADTQVD